MPDRGGGERFLTKSGYKLGIVPDEIGKDDLDRVLRFEIRVPGFVNDTHAALTETPLKVVLLLENGRAAERLHRLRTVIGAGRYFIWEASLTFLALFHFEQFRRRTDK